MSEWVPGRYSHFMRTILRFLLPAVISAFPISAPAEIESCNGVWTNRGCESPAEPHKPALSVEPPAEPDDRDRSEMRRLYHDLDMRRLEARRKFNVQLEIGQALERCIGARAALEACRETTALLEEKLTQRIADAQLLQEQKRTNELLSRKSEDDEATVDSITNITIHESDSDYRRPRHRHPYGHDYRLPPPPPPPTSRPRTPRGFKPQNRFQAGDGFE